MGEIQIKSGNLCERYTSVETAQQYSASLYMFADIQPSTTYTIAFEIDEGSLQYFNENLFTYSQYYVTGTGNKQMLQLNAKANIQKTASTWSDTYGWIIAKNYTGNATVPHWKKIQLLEGTYTSETIPEYQPYFLNRPAHRYTNGQWVDIPTHHFINGRWQGELTSQSPLKFRADGAMLDWRIEGKTSENLFDISTDLVTHLGFSSTSGGIISIKSTNNAIGFYVKCQPDKYYTLSRATNTNNRFSIGFTADEPVDGTPLLSYTPFETSDTSVTALSPSNANYICAYLTNQYDPITDDLRLMLNEGSTALPYEPYGSVGDWDETTQRYKIPVTVNGVTTNLFTDHQLLDGDSIDYATTETQIPIATGNNILTVDTAVKPSKVFVKFEG